MASLISDGREGLTISFVMKQTSIVSGSTLATTLSNGLSMKRIRRTFLKVIWWLGERASMKLVILPGMQLIPQAKPFPGG